MRTKARLADLGGIEMEPNTPAHFHNLTDCARGGLQYISVHRLNGLIDYEHARFFFLCMFNNSFNMRVC